MLALSGEKGLCNWGGEWEHKVCWPTDRSQLPDVERLVKRLDRSLEAAERAIGRAPGPPFVTGFSNGGFFVSMIASDSGFDAAGYAVFHGGAVTGQTFPMARARPFVLVTARQDSIQRPKMLLLSERLRAGGWAPALVTRDGEHELRPADVTAALDFFESRLR